MCTFQPKISKTSQQIITKLQKKSVSPGNSNFDNFYSRISKWKAENEKLKETMTKNKLLEEEKELTFKPDTTLGKMMQRSLSRNK